MSQSVSFIDVEWLQSHGGLTKSSVLEYFYTSPFYDPSSSNEACRRAGAQTSERLRGMTGLEFVFDEAHVDEPHLYVVRKQLRKSPVAADLLQCE